MTAINTSRVHSTITAIGTTTVDVVSAFVVTAEEIMAIIIITSSISRAAPIVEETTGVEAEEASSATLFVDLIVAVSICSASLVLYEKHCFDSFVFLPFDVRLG